MFLLPEARERLAIQQAALLRALADRAAPPDGFDPTRLRATADALARKRARGVARTWPALAGALSDRLGPLFAAYAAATRPRARRLGRIAGGRPRRGDGCRLAPRPAPRRARPAPLALAGRRAVVPPPPLGPRCAAAPARRAMVSHPPGALSRPSSGMRHPRCAGRTLSGFDEHRNGQSESLIPAPWESSGDTILNCSESGMVSPELRPPRRELPRLGG